MSTSLIVECPDWQVCGGGVRFVVIFPHVDYCFLSVQIDSSLTLALLPPPFVVGSEADDDLAKESCRSCACWSRYRNSVRWPIAFIFSLSLLA